MRKIKLYLFMITLLCIAGSMSACGKEDNSSKVTVYVEYNGSFGSEDEEVEKAIEEKFYKDTGLEIDLQIEAANTDMLGQKIVTAMADEKAAIDGFVNHYSSDGAINSYILDGMVMDLTDLVKELAPSFYASFNSETDPKGEILNAGTLDGKLYALSAKFRPSGWALLIRKDYMEKTSFNPDDYDILNENHKAMSLDDFKQMLVEMKNNTDVVRPLVGRPWSLDYFFTSPFGAVTYSEYVLDKDNNLIPAYADDAYLKTLELYRWLQEERLWTENPSNAQNLLVDFISGKGAVYCDWPEITSQISVARQLYNATGVESVVIEPFLKEGSDTETNGNSYIKEAFEALAIPLKSKNYELLLKYIEWLYSDVENYELAKYGIEGKHWVKIQGEHGEYYWDYPEDKKEQYMNALPYSGKFCLIEDYNMSDMLWADYNEEEKTLVNKVREFPVYPTDGYVTDGMILPSIPATERELRMANTAHYGEYTLPRSYAWSDAAFPDGQTIESMWQLMKNNLYTQYSAIIDFRTQAYRDIIENQQKQ
ncbi:MAG: extracellular solute-binding protein [Tyzzerella sp.]|nr:extracellular solute-binding protein [Tyzzerella sp.]